VSTPSQPCFPHFLSNVYTPHLLLISSFHYGCDQLFFISSYYVSTPSQPCFLHLLSNVYHPISSSDLFIPHCPWALLHLF
jgi:hypothetical protein